MTELITNTIRSLRANATPAEKKFWQMVRNRKLAGYRFYRQHPIEFKLDGIQRFFVADFYCKECNLVVEIDGGIHECQKEYDTYRTFIIERLGMQVVRFTNDEIRYKSDIALEKLKEYLTD